MTTITNGDIGGGRNNLMEMFPNADIIASHVPHSDTSILMPFLVFLWADVCCLSLKLKKKFFTSAEESICGILYGYMDIRLSTHPLLLNSYNSLGVLEPIPAGNGWRQGTPGTRHQFITTLDTAYHLGVKVTLIRGTYQQPFSLEVYLYFHCAASSEMVYEYYFQEMKCCPRCDVHWCLFGRLSKKHSKSKSFSVSKLTL